MISALIQTPSVSCVTPKHDMSNLAVIELLAEWSRSLGFAVEVLPVDDKPGHYNMVATLGSGAGGLVLAGHTDTVPCDEGLWDSDPFKAVERDNRLYGLGTTDMKSFLAIALEAARQFKDSTFNRPLTLVATADEESGMKGAEALAAAGQLSADCAVIGEPTNLRPVRMHKGVIFDCVRIIGKSGHSSNPAYGNSALEGMNQVMNTLLKLRGEMQARYHHPFFDVPTPTLNLGCIHGGDNPNRICGACELSYDLRILPGMDRDEIRQWVQASVRERLKDTGLKVEFDTQFPGIQAVETSPEADIVKASERLSGHRAEAVAFGTEAPYFKAMGMDVVVMGPGSISLAHQPNEYLELDQIQPTIDILRQLINRFCIQPEPIDL
jgi:acetylornithine deacetylase